MRLGDHSSTGVEQCECRRGGASLGHDEKKGCKLDDLRCGFAIAGGGWGQLLAGIAATGLPGWRASVSALLATTAFTTHLPLILEDVVSRTHSTAVRSGMNRRMVEYF